MLDARFQKNPQHQRRKESGRSKRECRRHQKQNVGWFLRGHKCRAQSHHQQQNFGNRDTPGGGRIGIDGFVVHIVRECIGNGQQQTIGRRERSRQTTCGHHARDDIRQPAYFRVAKTMMSPPIFISANWMTPSLLISDNDNKLGSTCRHEATQAGKSENDVPMRL